MRYDILTVTRPRLNVLIFLADDDDDVCLQCFDTVGWASGRASGL